MIKFIAKVPQGWQVISHMQPMHFPAGEEHVTTPEDSEQEQAVCAYVTGTDLNDYMALIEWADVIHSRGQQAVGIIPYLPAARADRGVPFGAKHYADLINLAQLDQVICFDPHSHVMPSLINNLTIVDAAALVRDIVVGRSGLDGYVGVIAPDEGATERTAKLGEALNLPVFHAKKHRDFETGKLSGFSCEPLPDQGRLLVADDICDGGGTFLGLAAATGLPRERLSLWVSHGVFSGRANQLVDHFATIYTTDSYPNATREDVGAVVTPLLGYLMRYITVHN